MAADFVLILNLIWDSGLVNFLLELIPLSLYFTVSNIGSLIGSYAAFYALASFVKRFRKSAATVFISFQHSYEDEAREVFAAIERLGLKPVMLPYEPRDRDEVIHFASLLSCCIKCSGTCGYTGLFGSTKVRICSPDSLALRVL